MAENGYGKRPLWQWILIYAVLGAIAYGLIYYFLIGKKEYTPSTPEAQKQEQPQAKVESAELKAVGTYKGSGTATRSFDGKTFTHTVSADLDDPRKGTFYEGWLVKKEPTLVFFSTGKLEKENGKYTLRFTADQNYPDYKDVVITEETSSMGLDGKPEAHVLEGTF